MKNWTNFDKLTMMDEQIILQLVSSFLLVLLFVPKHSVYCFKEQNKTEQKEVDWLQEQRCLNEDHPR